MAEQWTWESVSESLRGEWREFVRVCNRRFRDLQNKIASLVSLPVGGGTTNVLSKWDSAGTGLVDSGWSDSGSLLTAARPVDLGGTIGAANFIPAYPSAPVNGTYLMRVLGTISTATGSALAVHSSLGGTGSGLLCSPVFVLSANNQTMHNLITGPRITPGGFTGAAPRSLLVQGPRDTVGAAIAAGGLNGTAYGIEIDNIDAGTVANYAIKTGTGLVSLGDDVDFNQNQGLEFVVENRTSDPASPVTGQLWIRTDL